MSGIQKVNASPKVAMRGHPSGPTQALKKPKVADLVGEMGRATRHVIQEGWGPVRSRSPVEALKKPPVVDMVEVLRRAARDVIEGRSPAVQALRKPAVVDVVGHMHRAARAAIQQMRGRVHQRSPVESLEKPAVVDVVDRTKYVTRAAVESRPHTATVKPSGKGKGKSRIDITV